ncbi:hypothetical protein Fmac_010748 [Flemingia macrophylla]|uniref:Uncharacterized protein n=1 Tax=Flemingia macrophylla TaxID=520843 RepID=A0ABD1ML78_9FABA
MTLKWWGQQRKLTQNEKVPCSVSKTYESSTRNNKLGEQVLLFVLLFHRSADVQDEDFTGHLF